MAHTKDTKPAPHADRDGSERRRSMEREHERGLAADVAEPSSILTFDQKLSEADVATIKSLFAKAERLRKRAVKAEAEVAERDTRIERITDQWRETNRECIKHWNRADKAEAALARVEALAEQWERGYNSPTASSWAKVHADLLRAALAEPGAVRDAT